MGTAGMTFELFNELKKITLESNGHNRDQVFFLQSGALLRPIFSIEAVKETAFIQFSNDARINEVLHFDIADPGILSSHQPLQGFEAFDRYVRFSVFFQANQIENILVGTFSRSRIR